MNHPRQNRLLTFGLYLNAALLLAVLMVFLGRETPASVAMPALGQNVRSAAGNGEMLVVGGQLAPNAWGIYLVDTGAQTLSVYQFQQDRQLRLIAARDIRHDRRLRNFNTFPAPQEVAELVEKEKQSDRVIREDRQE